MLHATPQERLALGVTALLLAAGAGFRILAPRAGPVGWQQIDGAPADTVERGAAGALLDATRAEVARGRVRARPLQPGERIDPNRASADELDRLPRVGPALAARLVEWRSARPFRSLADLDSVPGIGPRLLREIGPFVILPAAPPHSPGGSARRVDLNRATAAELDALPGVGPVTAGRIVAWREANGRFRSVLDLEGVPGIGPVLRARLEPVVEVGP